MGKFGALMGKKCKPERSVNLTESMRGSGWLRRNYGYQGFAFSH